MSQKNRTTTVPSSPTAVVGSSGSSYTSEQNIPLAPNTTTAVRPSQLSSSMSSSELSKSSGIVSGNVGTVGESEQTVRKGIGNWNPFHDPTPFSQMTEDHIFDAEFDAIRHRGSQSSKCIIFINFYPFWCFSFARFAIVGITSNSKGATPPATTTPDVAEDPFGSAPFSLPAALRERATSIKKTGGKA